MTNFDDPNRESVGLPPIWTGAGDPPDPPPEGGAAKRSSKKPKDDDDAVGVEQEKS